MAALFFHCTSQLIYLSGQSFSRHCHGISDSVSTGPVKYWVVWCCIITSQFSLLIRLYCSLTGPGCCVSGTGNGTHFHHISGDISCHSYCPSSHLTLGLGQSPGPQPAPCSGRGAWWAPSSGSTAASVWHRSCQPDKREQFGSLAWFVWIT